jgi:hypothetical protein
MAHRSRGIVSILLSLSVVSCLRGIILPLLTLQLLFSQQATLSWIGGKNGAMEWALSGDIHGSVLASTAYDGPTRNPFFEDALQFFGQLELLGGVTLHP